jgi:hypothetical protein
MTEMPMRALATVSWSRCDNLLLLKLFASHGPAPEAACQGNHEFILTNQSQGVHNAGCSQIFLMY